MPFSRKMTRLPGIRSHEYTLVEGPENINRYIQYKHKLIRVEITLMGFWYKGEYKPKQFTNDFIVGDEFPRRLCDPLPQYYFIMSAVTSLSNIKLVSQPAVIDYKTAVTTGKENMGLMGNCRHRRNINGFHVNTRNE